MNVGLRADELSAITIPEPQETGQTKNTGDMSVHRPHRLRTTQVRREASA
jgi:hypothetical protein